MDAESKYSVNWCNDSTGSWDEYDCDTIKEVTWHIEGKTGEWNHKVTVYDRQLRDFIYYKHAYEEEAEINLLFSNERDLRTKTRKELIV